MVGKLIFILPTLTKDAISCVSFVDSIPNLGFIFGHVSLFCIVMHLKVAYRKDTKNYRVEILRSFRDANDKSTKEVIKRLGLALLGASLSIRLKIVRLES